MIQFWATAAGLIILAMLFIVLPLLRFKPKPDISSDELNLAVIKQQLAELDTDLESGELDRESYAAARHDLEKELLEDLTPAGTVVSKQPARPGRWITWPLLVAVPAMAISLYLALGNPESIPRLELAASAGSNSGNGSQSARGQAMAPMADLVERLAERMKQQPDNLEGWKMLGRSYVALNRYDDALKAYERGYQLNPEDTGLLLNYAATMAGLNNGQFAGRPTALIAKALELEPENPNALWLMGSAYYQQAEYAKSVALWERLITQLKPGSEEVAGVSEYLNKARAQLSPGSAATAAPPPSPE